MTEKKGFTLIEILISLAILIVILSIAVPLVSNRQSRAVFESDVSQALSVLRQAQSQAISKKAGKQWGVYFDTDALAFSLYAGQGYEERDTVYDELYKINKDLEVGIDAGKNDINFSNKNGFPQEAVDIGFEHTGAAKTALIKINKIGKIERND